MPLQKPLDNVSKHWNNRHVAQISKRKVDDKVLDKTFRLFFEIVGNRKNRNEFFLVSSELLSPTERIMLGKRIAIVYLLLKDIDKAVIRKF